MLIGIHGTPGEDGRLQGYFDLIGLPYSCCGVLAAALTFSKFTCNQYLKGFGVQVAESVLLRVEKRIDLLGAEANALQKDIAQVYLNQAVEKVNNAGKSAITSFAESDELRVMLMGLKRFTKIEPLNLKDARRRIADALIAKNDYIF